jgi:hypothetical protein
MTSSLLAARGLFSIAVLFVGAAGAEGCSSAAGEANESPFPDSSTASPAAGSDGDKDSAAPDAMPPGPGSPDAQADASTCQPGDVQIFQPSYHPATGPFQGACIARTDDGPNPIRAYFDACLGENRSVRACTDFKHDYEACAKCIQTPTTAARYGPLIEYGRFVFPNVPGCLELIKPVQLSCAKSLQAISSCELAACGANCPVRDATTLAAYSSCAAEADHGGCAAYAAAATCFSPSVAPTCAQDFQHFYDSVVPLFCGPPPRVSKGPAAPSPRPSLDAAAD